MISLLQYEYLQTVNTCLAAGRVALSLSAVVISPQVPLFSYSSTVVDACSALCLFVFQMLLVSFLARACSPVALDSYLSAVTEKITGRDQDECPDDPRRDEEDYSTGQAKNDMGDSRMDILRSEIACERRNFDVDVSRRETLPGIGS